MIDTTPQQFKAVIKTLSKEQTTVIQEIIVNLLKGNLTLDEKTIRQLRKYRLYLRKIAQGHKPSNGKVLYHVFVLLRSKLSEI